jgi:hypothetical protein
MIKETRYCDLCGCKVELHGIDHWTASMNHGGSVYYSWSSFLDLCDDCFDVQIDYFEKVLNDAGFRNDRAKQLTKEQKENHIKKLRDYDDKIKDFEDHIRGG